MLGALLVYGSIILAVAMLVSGVRDRQPYRRCTCGQSHEVSE